MVLGYLGDFRNWLGLNMPPGQPLSLGFQISNYLANYASMFIISKKFHNNPISS